VLLGVAACTPISRSEADRGATVYPPPPAIGDPFPDVVLQDRDGRPTGAEAWLGSVAVVAFVSFGRGASAAESGVVIERMLELPDRLPSTPLRLILLPLTPVPGAPPAPARLMSAPLERTVALAAAFGVALSTDGSRYRHGHATVVIDRSGRIRAILRGVTSWDAVTLAREAAVAATW